jgi:hypothetical protein
MGAEVSQQRWVDVAVFEEVNDAKTIESFLTKKRLEARTYNEKFFRFFLFLHMPRPTYQVQVRYTSLKFAGEVLDEAAPEALQRAIRCPACHSLHVAYPQLTRPSILSTIRLHLGLIFHVLEHECCCQRCQCRWHLPVENVNAAPEPAGDRGRI